MRTSRSYPVAFFGTALMLSLSACTTEFISGVSSGPTGTGGGGGGTTGSVSSTAQSTSTGGPTLLPAVALTSAQLEALYDQYGSAHFPSHVSSGSSGTGIFDPNVLFLYVSDLGVSCDALEELSCGLHYDMNIGLPPALQAVGVYDFGSMELESHSVMSVKGKYNASDPTSCSITVGWPEGGSLEILSIDATEVHFNFSFTDPFLDTDFSGEFIAPRCP